MLKQAFFLTSLIVLLISCKETKTENVTTTIDSTNLDGTAIEETTQDITSTEDAEVTKIDTISSNSTVEKGNLANKEAIKTKTLPNNQISNIREMEGYFQYFAESMVFYPCQTQKRFKVIDNAACKEVMAKYRAISTEGAEKVYLRCMAEFTDFKSEDGGRLLIGLSIDRILVFDPKKSCR